MLELEPPRHTRLRSLVLRAFTARRVAELQPEIEGLAEELIDGFPDGPFDLLSAFAQPLPVRIIARLLGVPEDMAPDLLRWSNAMVGMYMAGRTRAMEDRAVAATEAFVAFLRGYVEDRRKRPADDLITHLIAAEEAGERLTTDELITTCILLLNAGHEATVHTIGNGVKALLEAGTPPAALAPDRVERTVEEILRFDPALHMFTRWAYEDIEVMGQRFARGDQVGLLLAAANRDPGCWDKPGLFRPDRPPMPLVTFGAGLHFCVGAPLARLELQLALPILFARCPACGWWTRRSMPMSTISTDFSVWSSRRGEAIAPLPRQGFFVCPRRRAFGWRCGMRGPAPQTPRSICQKAMQGRLAHVRPTSGPRLAGPRQPYVCHT